MGRFVRHVIMLPTSGFFLWSQGVLGTLFYQGAAGISVIHASRYATSRRVATKARTSPPLTPTFAGLQAEIFLSDVRKTAIVLLSEGMSSEGTGQRFLDEILKMSRGKSCPKKDKKWTWGIGGHGVPRLSHPLGVFLRLIFFTR